MLGLRVFVTSVASAARLWPILFSRSSFKAASLSPFSFFLLWNFGCLSEKVEQTSSHLTSVANWSNLQMKKHISFALIRLFGTERQLDSRYCTTNASYIQYKENDKTSDYTWSLYSFVYSNKNGNMYPAKISNFYFFKQTVGSTIRVNQV